MPKSDQPRDDDEIRRKGSRKAGSVFGLLVLGMVVVGLGGYGVSDFGNSVDTAIRVGEVEVSAQDYNRALQVQINQISRQFGQQFTLEQARLFGLDQQVLQSLVGNAALSNEAQRIGLSASDLSVAKIIAQTEGVADVTGKFDKATYQRMLENNGFAIADYEADVRADLARQALQAAIATGQVAPEAMTRALYAHAQETRGFSLLQLTQASLPAPLPEPTEAELQAWYDAHLPDFTRPEAKRVSYALLTPADLAKDQVVDEAAVQAAYDGAADVYNVPEKRLVERLVYPTEEEAKAARAELDAGKSFDDLVAARGLDLASVDLGDVARVDLGAAADGVFALTEPGTVGPLPTDLGPATFRVNAVLEAQVTPFEEVAEKLRTDLATESARKAIAEGQEAVDDLLAGGASVEEIAADRKMTLGTTDYAVGAEDNDPLTADPAFVAALAATEPGDFAQSLTLADGSMMVLQVTDTLASAPIPLDKALARATAAFKSDQLAKALSALADQHLAAAQSGTRLEALGIVDRVASTLRTAVPDGIPSEAVAEAFKMAQGDLAKIETAGVVAVILLDSVTPADLESDAAKTGFAALGEQIAASLAQDAYGLFTTDLANSGGLTIDQAVINAVQSRM